MSRDYQTVNELSSCRPCYSELSQQKKTQVTTAGVGLGPMPLTSERNFLAAKVPQLELSLQRVKIFRSENVIPVITFLKDVLNELSI